MSQEKRYWYTHAESDSVWIGLDGEAPGSDLCVVQHREAKSGEIDDEESIEKFEQELKDNWKNKQIQ